MIQVYVRNILKVGVMQNCLKLEKSIKKTPLFKFIYLFVYFVYELLSLEFFHLTALD